jgi:hypothetical protein
VADALAAPHRTFALHAPRGAGGGALPLSAATLAEAGLGQGALLSFRWGAEEAPCSAPVLRAELAAAAQPLE